MVLENSTLQLGQSGRSFQKSG